MFNFGNADTNILVSTKPVLTHNIFVSPLAELQKEKNFAGALKI